MTPVAASRISTVKTVPNRSGETIREITAFMRGLSIETTRTSADDLAALKGAMPARTCVYLTSVPGRPPGDLIEPATRLRAAGFEPIPHLAARHFGSIGMLDDVVSRLVAQAGVRRALVIAGDRDLSAGPFTNSVELIECGLLQRCGIVEIGVAGYPEGHPRLPELALDQALAAKVEAAEQTGLAVHIVTQFAFDPNAILRWVSRLRDLGFEHPIRLGMAGPVSLSDLLRYAQRCGVRASARGLARQGGLIKHLIGTSAPDGLIRVLAEACATGKLGQVAPHFYSFGGAAATARWTAAVAAGRIVLGRVDGFAVEPP